MVVHPGRGQTPTDRQRLRTSSRRRHDRKRVYERQSNNSRRRPLLGRSQPGPCIVSPTNKSMFPCIAIFFAVAKSDARRCTCANGMLFRPYRSPNWKAHNARAASASNAIADSLPGYVLRDWACMALRTLALLAAGTRVANAPNGVRAVIRYQQRSVLSHGDANRPSPDATVVDHKSSDKIFVLAAGPACLMSRYANDLIAGAHGPVP